MKKLLIPALLLLVVIGVYFGYNTLYPKPMPKSAGVAENSVTIFTLDQIAEHGNKDSCWLAIEGKVYDVTPFVASGFHPGKDAILEGCGRDATELFNTRPMGSKTPHSDKARESLVKYYIGELIQS